MIEYVDARSTTVRARAAEAGAVASFVRRLDWVLLGAVGALVGLGLWAIAGITRDDELADPNYFVKRQALYAGVGVAGLVLALAVNPDVYRRHTRVVYGVTVGLVLFVLVAAEAVRGSRRWIDVGPFRFQPAEFGKLLLVLALAGFLAERYRRLREARTVLAAVGLAAAPMFLVFLQPDVGTALVYAAALAGVLFFAGTRWLHLGSLAAIALVGLLLSLWLLPSVGVHVLKPYQEERLTGFTHPDEDPGGTTYNVKQSITAIGAGGMEGRGVSGATQTRLDYLPEHATDFAFASFAEQRGFVGTAILLALYLLVVWRGLRLITIARDPFSAIASGGIVVGLLFQIFVNVGMTMGIAPVTGIPLPFVSVGGSSLIMNLIAIGVLQAIYARSPRKPVSPFAGTRG